MKRLTRRDLIRAGGVSIAGAFATSLMGQACSPFQASEFTNDSLETNASAEDPSTPGSPAPDPIQVPAENPTCSLIPAETEGPYPADDDSALNVLRLDGVVRRDIRASLGTGNFRGTAVATGAPLTLTFQLVDVGAKCAPLSGYAIYIWHCDQVGRYSMYTPGVTSETYLRGVQETDSQGRATLVTVFPGCYPGRVPHIHFEIFPRLSQAVDNQYVRRISQLAFPQATLDSVYSLTGYEVSRKNSSRITNAQDEVFRDGTANQIVTMGAGNVMSGLTANLKVGIRS